MPRPKVKPQDRQRSARACIPCKASKIRCDAVSPCGPCCKRDRTSECAFLESNRKRRKTSQSSPFPIPSLEDESPAPFIEPSLLPVPRAPSTAATVTRNTTPTPEPGQSTSRSTQSRMLLSSKGEKLYVGETASLSFLQFLRQVLKKYMGPSAFTENQFKDNMLEVDMARDESPLVFDQNRGEKYALVQLYREASSGILDLFTMEETNSFLERHNDLSPSNVFDDNEKHARAEQAALNIMLAIGSQCRGQNPPNPFNATRSFTCAQKWAFEGFLCDPSLNMVRVFLLMAFYMLGACHRNAAFMYLGIASKAACALGLHHKDQYRGLTSQECLTRWRTWKSCLILDTIVSSILGRPGGLPPMRPEDDSAYHGHEVIGEHDRPRWLASRAVFSISSHIIELEQHLGTGNVVDSNIAKSFLERLRKWNDTLPPELRHFAGIKQTTLGSADRELFIGATHVACTYYFTIILVTRPFLISHLVSQLRRRRMRVRRPSMGKTEQSPVSDLAQACLDSAIYMAETGYTAMNSMILSNNMCLLKAWMFAAGLLLGFALFAQSEPAPEIGSAFQNAIVVLERLAQLSPQAKHYFDILSTLSEAIQTMHEQLGRERRKKSDRLVSQIFTADFHSSDSNNPLPPFVPNTAPTRLSSTTSYRGPHSSSNIDPSLTGGVGDLDGFANFDFGAPEYDLSAFAQADDWADMPLLSQNLYIDWESIWPVLDG